MFYEENITILEIVTCYVETNGTVRKVARKLGVSKTNVHCKIVKFIQETHIYQEEKELAFKAKALLEKNKQERHLRGGNATKQKNYRLKTVKK